jgi:outer membrane protein, heavy metal efflux system
MKPFASCRLFGAAALLLCAGCQLFPVREHVDEAVCGMAKWQADLQPLSHPADLHAEADGDLEGGDPPTDRAKDRRGRKEGTEGRKAEKEPGDKAGEEEGADRPAEADRLIPPGLPGGRALPLELPPEAKTDREKARAVEEIYPPLAALPVERPLPPGPTGHPVTLADLQQLALTNSPQVRQAAAEVESARGQAIQAGLCPNPTVGYEADSIRQGDTAGLQGAFVEQTIKTAGKLRLARERGLQEVRLAEIALARARFDLMTRVRTGYFNVLAARTNVRVSRLLADFTDRVYRIQVDRVKAGQAALYEPAQLRVLAVQARNALAQARNREAAAWKALAATLGLPGLPPKQLAGRIDMPVPAYRYDDLLARALTRHTDVLQAKAQIDREQLNLHLARVTPIPDVSVGLTAQQDYTTPPFNAVFNVRVGVALPVWDRNQGNIIDAQARLERAMEGPHRARVELTARLAEAFERYQSNRTVLENYRRFILADQVRAFRGAYDAHQANPDRVGFGEVVNAQQTLAASVTAYVSALAAMWQAVVDAADLLQTEDLFQVAESHSPAPVPDLPELPCRHPCSPVHDPRLHAPEGSWPASLPAGPAPTRKGEKGEGEELPAPRKLPPAAKGTGRRPGRAKNDG